MNASYAGEVRLPDWLMKMNLSRGAKLTYSVLSVCSSGRNIAWPRQEYLAERVSASVRSVQRYLGELARNGLIAVSRETHKGKNRCLYSFPGQGDKLSPQDVASRPSDTTKCRIRGDNLSCSYKDEDIKGKRNIPPLTPQTPEPELKLLAAEADSGGESVDFTEDAGKDSAAFPAAENSIWRQIKTKLMAEWGERTVKTWLEPLHLQFDEQAKTVALWTPNGFFLDWLKKHYAAGLKLAFQEAGYEARLELGEVKRMTPKEEKQAPPAVTASPLRREPNWAILTPEEQFGKVYEAYPRKENFWRGLRVFRNLLRQGECPAPGQLLKAIGQQEQGEAWRREAGRFVPQIAKWLEERRWLDFEWSR